MKEYLLYILIFRNKKYFKFGITGVLNLSRIKNLNSKYDIDIEESFIYRSSKYSITYIESKLKENDFIPVYEFSGFDGYTEIRHISELENTLKIIESNNQFNLKKESLTDYYNLVNVKVNSKSLIEPVSKIEHYKKVKTSGLELPETNLNIGDITDIDIPYHLTLR